MLSKDNIKQMVRGFLHEACGYLGIDDTKISIAYMPMPFPTMMVMLLKESDDIVIDTNILKYFAQGNKYTVLRSEVYRVSREIFQRRKQQSEGIKVDDQTNANDALAFAYALCFLNGLFIPIPQEIAKDLEPIILHILNDEFLENCILHKLPEPQYPGVFSYRAKKTKEAHKAVIRLYNQLRPSLCATDVSNAEKGSEENPFDNVFQARDFIKSQERKALKKDTYMSQVLAKRKFNYCPETNIYNIKWADGKSAYCHPEIPEGSFIVNQLFSGKFSLKPNLYGRKFLYRGQSKFYPNCTLGLFRDKKQNYYLKELIQYDEFRAVLASHPLVQLFEKGFDLWYDLFRFEINYGGLAQHYYNKTRFLDLTSDINTAIFFATTDYDSSKDEYTPHTEVADLGVMYYYEISEPGAFQPQKHQHLSTIGKQPFMRSGNQHGFLLNMDKGANFNDFPQVHKVFFRHDPNISAQIFAKLNEGATYFPSDILKIQWKRFMAQFSSDSTVSLEAVKINVRDNIIHKESVRSITSKLDSLYGIKVDQNRKPCFDADLMDRYFEDMRNGWWQDVFCRDIYFASADGAVYKDMLLHLPLDPRYSKYFSRN